jgi:hypothetical protein
MLQEADDVLWFLHQGLQFHATATLGAFLNVLGECPFQKLAPRAIDGPVGRRPGFGRGFLSRGHWRRRWHDLRAQL